MPSRTSKMQTLKNLIENNRRWASSRVKSDADFFKRLAHIQKPRYLWIGCSDSRVPANDIVGLLPGELFVHRNVANVVVHTDLNCLSVIQYAVDVLKIQDIIVCGHYGCGGVRAAMQKTSLGLIDNWLRHVQDVARTHQHTLAAIKDHHKRCDKLCELNVREQMRNVCETTIVQDAWERKQKLAVHAWIYNLHDGLIRDLELSVSKNHPRQSR